jgi:N4-gp56 family major capsid protein
MTLSAVAAANTAKQWDAEFYREYIRANRFAKYQGTDANSVIQLKEQLTKKPGDAITVSLLKALSGAGVTGNTLLEGAEDTISNYGHQISIAAYRNAVAMTEWEEQKTAMAMREAARPLLSEWSMDLVRQKVVSALGSIQAVAGSTIYAYGSASEGNKDTWLAANADRVLFGATKSNNAANDHSAALTQIDSTNDKLTYSVVSLAKRMAKLADPIIRPIRVNDDEEWYVMFANSLAFRDLKASLATINKDAMQRGKDNPLFTDGDLVYDGVIIREVPEIGVIADVGNGGTVDVAPCYLCGAQALGHVIGKRWQSSAEERDYGFVNGVAVTGFFGIEKLFFNAIQHGVCTVYVSGEPDA